MGGCYSRCSQQVLGGGLLQQVFTAGAGWGVIAAGVHSRCWVGGGCICTTLLTVKGRVKGHVKGVGGWSKGVMKVCGVCILCGVLSYLNELLCELW